MHYVTFPSEYLKLLVDGLELHAESCDPRALGSYVRLVDQIQAQARLQNGPRRTIRISDEGLELVADGLESSYKSTHGTLFTDKGFIALIQIFRDAEAAALAADGKKPPVRESLDIVHTMCR